MLHHPDGGGAGAGRRSRHVHAPTLSDMVNTWYQLHGHTLKDAETRLARTLAICHRLGNPVYTSAAYIWMFLSSNLRENK